MFQHIPVTIILTVAVSVTAPQLLRGADHAHGTPAAKGESQGAKKAANETTNSKQAALQPAAGAKIKILAPSKGQVVKGDKVEIHYQLTKGKRGHHAHAYVDGELVGMFESAKGTLNGIKPGKHSLELRVVAADHKTELDAIDKIDFTVK